jgi:hypothetical protein
VSRFGAIEIPVIVREHRAADWSHGDGFFTHSKLVYHFGDEPVRDAVAAAGAIMSGDIFK